MRTQQQGAYSEVSGKFVCVHCGKILLGKYPCRTMGRDDASEDGEDSEDDDTDTEGVKL